MHLQKQLNIKGIVSPLNLFQYQSAIGKMTEGECMEIILSDRTVLDALTRIINRSADRMLYTKQQGSDFYIGVKKGKPLLHGMHGGEI